MRALIAAASRFLRRHHGWTAAALLACMALLLGHAALVDSPIIDEPNHITRGLAFWQAGDARLSTAHPPLANALQAIPGALLGEPFDFAAYDGWARWDVERVARAILALDYERVRAAIVAGRFVTILLTLLLGLYLFRFCLRFGRVRALWCLFLFALSPLFLAHGHLVTTDLPAALGVTVAVGELVRWIEGGSRWRLVGSALAAGAAIATKFSGLLVLPVFAIAAGAAALAGVGRFAGASAGARAFRLLRAGIFTGLAVLLVINLSYGFGRSFWTVRRTLEEPEPANWITARHQGRLLERLSPLADWPSQLRLPVPYPWAFGLFSIDAQNERGHGGWFLGEKRSEPSRLYFPTLLLIKSPAALLLLLAAAATFAALRFRPRRRASLQRLALWAAPLLLLVLALFARVQIGVRHVLPVVPFLILAGAWGAALLSRRAPAAGAGLALLLCAEVAANHPRYIGHFSSLVGGGAVGRRISIVGEDWGQEAAELGAIAVAEKIEPLYYAPYGNAASREFRRAGAKFRGFGCKGRQQLRDGAWLAVHAAQLLRWGRCGPVDAGDPPDRTVGGHIWLYRIGSAAGVSPPRGSAEPPQR